MFAITAAPRSWYLSLSAAVVGGVTAVSLLPLGGTSAAASAAPVTVELSPTVTEHAAVQPAPAARPDEPAPAGAVSALVAQQEAAGLTCSTSARGVPLCVHGADSHDAAHHGASAVAGTASGATPTGDSRHLGCYGDGTSGPRVRAVYARPQSARDGYQASLPSIRGWAAGISKQFDESAAVTRGRRHVRFATTAGVSCALTVLNVVLPDAAFRSFEATVDALESRGLDAKSSKYLVWADAAGLCGMATTYADDSAGLDNLNNSPLPSYARIDRRCWGKVETHELVHMLGGVQRSAPHSTAGLHCNDGSDLMCYADGTSGSAQRSVCPTSRIHLLDCRNDDYFSTAAPKGSYLQMHWNTARSSFLAATLSQAAPGGAPASTPAPSSSPGTSMPAPSPATAQPSVSPTATPSPSPGHALMPGLPALILPTPALPPPAPVLAAL